MTTIGAIYEFLDEMAPFSRQMVWDNSGLLVGSPEDEVERVVLALDATGPVVEEAAQKGVQLILSHHPVIFHPLKKVERGTPVYEAIRRGVGILCAHTNLDLAEGGVNDALAEMLSLQKLQPFAIESQENYVKIVVFTPEAEAEKVAKAMGDVGAGTLGAYSHCSFSSGGVGAFLPLEGASPHLGQVGRLEQVKETRVEMILPRGKISAAVAAMKAAHPYEVPAYDLFENQAVQETVSLGRIGELETAFSPREFAQFVKERLQGGGEAGGGLRRLRRGFGGAGRPAGGRCLGHRRCEARPAADRPVPGADLGGWRAPCHRSAGAHQTPGEIAGGVPRSGVPARPGGERSRQNPIAGDPLPPMK